MNNIYSIFELSDDKKFQILNEKNIFTKKDIIKFINNFENNIRKIIPDLSNEKIYIDIKNRFIYIIVLLTLQKLNAKVVLVPIEIKREDYYYEGGIFISDNKKFDDNLFINSDFNIEIGKNFLFKSEKINDDVIIYLYTSGSTGKSKLIPKKIRNILTELDELKKIFNFNNITSFYFTPPLYHIYGILFGFLLPVYISAKLYIDYLFTPETIADFVEENNIEYFVSIPSYYKMFIDLGIEEKFKNCKLLISSSAPLPLEISKLFYNKNIKIIEIYGSTETGGIAHRISAISEHWNLFSYVKVIKDHIFDNEDSFNLELKIISPAISIEYNEEEGFNTGDIIELHSDFEFKLLGRNTRFVKIGGKRLDLNYVSKKVKEYIESYTNKEVKEDSIYVGEKDEKIYVLYEDEFPDSSQHIKEELKKHLPGYAIPRFFITTKIPRNEMGKISKIKIDSLLYELYNI